MLATAQHRQILDQVLVLFDIVPDVDLNIVRPNQSLPDLTLTARILMEVNQVPAQRSLNTVLVQGDTTTVMATALACFYRQIPFGHVEAGLRTGDMTTTPSPRK